ncbi:MAG: hypothetical protein LBU84_11385 [Prevotella sp.]|jgi:hypothetical protein|nr:hypothetical protein [Prevotella sp.]
MRILLISIILLTVSCHAQKNIENNITDNCTYYYDKELKKDVYISTEKESEYPNSLDEHAFIKSILDNIDYSNVAEIWYEEGITPNYLCSITLDKKGKAIRCKIAENKNDNIAVLEIKKQIEEIILKGKEWTPAKCNGKEIYSVVNLKIRIPQSYYLK